MGVESRKLRVVVRTAHGALPVVVAASVVPASSCGSDSELSRPQAAPQTAGRSSHGAAGTGGAGNATFGASGRDAGVLITPGTAGASFDAGQRAVPDGGGLRPGMTEADCLASPSSCCDFTVNLPAEGTPAEPGQICAAMMTPVDSNRAAHVTLTAGADGLTVKGSIELAPGLIGLVAGTPSVEVIDATDPMLLGLAIGQIVPSAKGFAFDALWPNSAPLARHDLTRITVRVAFQVLCSDMTQLVHAVTDVHLCDGGGTGGAEWVSSGSVCTVCRVIAEMAPSPIVPEPREDGMPLSRVLRLRVVELARVSGTVVLWAEHDGGAGLDYEWQASAGEIAYLAPDVVALSAREGMAAPFVQVAAFSADAAAVASWGFNDEAA